MNLKEIISKIEISQVYIEELNDSIQCQEELIKKLYDSIDFEELKTYKYSELIEIDKRIGNIISWDDRAKLTIISEEVKKKEYPILNKAHYYPIINELDYLDDERKNKLDKLLDEWYNKTLNTMCRRWYDLYLNIETTDKIIEFLLEKGVLEKQYAIYCDCGNKCDPEIFDQNRYDEFIKYHNGEFNHLKITEDGLEDDEIWRKGYFYAGCWEDGDIEIDTLDLFLENVKVYGYKVVGKPDRSLDEI